MKHAFLPVIGIAAVLMLGPQATAQMAINLPGSTTMPMANGVVGDPMRITPMVIGRPTPRSLPSPFSRQLLISPQPLGEAFPQTPQITDPKAAILTVVRTN